MNTAANGKFPRNIICLTEESVETLFLLDKAHLIKGVSAFVKRPKAAQSLPKVSFFTSSNIKKIKSHNPDLVLGFSDIQKDIARDLIAEGMNVFVANHRSLSEILEYIEMLGRLVDAPAETKALIGKLNSKIDMAKSFAQALKARPKVYFEEWDDPMISGIQWVSELIELCGGIDINKELANAKLAKDRFVEPLTIIQKNPDLILGCWCGKKVNIQKILDREGFDKIRAVQTKNVFEVEPEIFLQPGPAPFLDGIDVLINIFKEWSKEEDV
ncbi:MAG: ABC transporter substrate-binding protein [Bacteriovoracaceae bacterium]